jgi:hypothetical protein
MIQVNQILILFEMMSDGGQVNIKNPAKPGEE